MIKDRRKVGRGISKLVMIMNSTSGVVSKAD